MSKLATDTSGPLVEAEYVDVCSVDDAHKPGRLGENAGG